jgi:class 3 adenylate cyclase
VRFYLPGHASGFGLRCEGRLVRLPVLALILLLTVAFDLAGLVFAMLGLPVSMEYLDWGFPGFNAVIGLACVPLGSLIVRTHARNRIGWLLVAIGLLSALQFPAHYYSVLGIVAPGRVPEPSVGAWLEGWLWVPAVGSAAVLMPLVFPTGRLLSPRWRPLLWTGLAGIVVASLGYMLQPQLAGTDGGSNPFFPAVDPGVAGALIGLGMLLLVSSMLLASLSLVLRFRRSRGIERQQIKWLTLAVAVGAAAFGLYAVVLVQSGRVDNPLAPLVALSFLGVIAAVGIAILRHRLLDIDLLLNRTAVYATVSALLATGFVLGNVALQYVVESLTKQRSELLSGALGVGIGLSFIPLRRRIRPVIDRFLPGRASLTLLFTDIVGSTQTIVDIGDQRWRAVLAQYRAAVRQELARYGGDEVDTAGDGFFATFNRPGEAVQAAWAIRSSVKQLGLETRTGLHLGEVEMRGERVSGLAVHTAARVMAAAGDGEVLVSDAVRDAIQADDVSLRDRGRQELKGVPGDWQLYAIEETR